MLALQVLEHNTHLQQELAHTTIITPAPASTAMQVSLLRAALAEANYRLTAAGLLPVAAIGLQEEPKTQVSTFLGLACLLTHITCPAAGMSACGACHTASRLS